MNIFRQSGNTKMDIEYVGVGSLISKQYLIVSYSDGDVSIINLKTFVVSNGSVVVEDIHHLSKAEVQKLIELIKDETFKDYAFTDFDFDTKGFKSGYISIRST